MNAKYQHAGEDYLKMICKNFKLPQHAPPEEIFSAVLSGKDASKFSDDQLYEEENLLDIS